MVERLGLKGKCATVALKLPENLLSDGEDDEQAGKSKISRENSNVAPNCLLLVCWKQQFAATTTSTWMEIFEDDWKFGFSPHLGFHFFQFSKAHNFQLGLLCMFSSPAPPFRALRPTCAKTPARKRLVRRPFLALAGMHVKCCSCMPWPISSRIKWQ